MTSAYNTLLKKLDGFTRKYYQNQMIRGLIYFVGIGISALLLSSILEYYGQFSSGIRRIMFFGLVGVFAFLLIRFLIIPLSKILRLGKLISQEQASRMIGKHFPNINDKLLNTLQLKNQADSYSGDTSLLLASIDQRIAELEPIPFSSAVNFGENVRYLKYALPPVVLAIILLLISPDILREGTSRIVTYDREYIPEAPFKFLVLNEDLEVPMNESYQLEVKVDGEYIPNSLSLDLGGKSFRLQSQGNGIFSYTFRNVRNDVPFRLFADGFYSQHYLLDVLPTPRVTSFSISADYPKYIGKQNETFQNTGNLQIPEGTRLAWNFKAENTEALSILLPDTTYSLKSGGSMNFNFSRKFFSSLAYSLAPSNQITGSRDTIAYRIEVIKDAYPKINVEESRDSSNERIIYFGGSINDDYGLSELQFEYVVTRESGETESQKVPIRISNASTQDFYHFQNFDELNLLPGDRIDYFFTVWDNDGVNGRKSARSFKGSFEAPTLEELKEERDQSSQSIKDKLEESIEKAGELQKELQELNKDLLKDNELNWQDKKKIQDVLNKQKSLEKEIESLRQERSEMQKKQEDYLKTNESILKKQEQLDKMFNELMSEEMKEMYRQLEELMKELNQDKLMEEMEKFQMSSEELEKELDRSLEIFKQLEVEQNFEQAMKDLEELAKKQEELKEKTENKEDDNEALKEQQEELNKEFEELSKDLEELDKKNQELERPMDIPSMEDAKEEVKEKMDSASEQIEQKKNQKASESQQGAAQKMQEMAQQMQAAMNSSQSESAQEDMDALRDLLENIIQLSFDQESIMEELKYLERNDPRYIEMGRMQRKLKDDSKMVEDSLFALSKRVVQIENIVNEEIAKVNQNISKALEDIGERQTASAASRQQYVMTSYNNLALLLDEALQQMQMQMANQMPGKGNCEKPGGMGANPNSGKMSKLQEQIGKKLDQMKKSLEKGGQKNGQKPGMGDQGMSKEIAKMAAEQAAIRKQIEKMAQELNQQGKGEGSGLKQIAEQMEELEKDLVNQEITRESLLRQQEIMTRLLESEKADREREKDNKRESSSPNPYEPSNPEKYLEYKRKKSQEVELLRTVPADLKPYYRERVNDYFLNFEN